MLNAASRLLCLLPWIVAQCSSADTFRIAAYNVENYLDRPTESRRSIKSAEAKDKVVEIVLGMKPDVLALSEMGAPSALAELQASLRSGGLNLPYSEFVQAWDTNIHVCVLSRFPIIASRSHTNASFLLNGRRFRVNRGFSEVDIKVNDRYQFTLLGAHLKSRRPSPEADETEFRIEEAKLLRRIVDRHLKERPDANLVVLGDLNDTYDSTAVKTIVGLGETRLVDTRPAEPIGDSQPNPRNPRWFPRDVTWTHHYGAADSYDRIDYIFLSPGMAREWTKAGTYIPVVANWGIASDHRPVLVTLEAIER